MRKTPGQGNVIRTAAETNEQKTGKTNTRETAEGGIVTGSNEYINRYIHNYIS